MKPSDLPLLLSSSAAVAADEQYPLDRIRMQKAVFMVVQRGPKPWRDFYEYRPYNWGPYSGELNADLGRLANENLVVTRESSTRYPAYVASPEGEVRAQELLATLTPEEKRFISAIRRYVTTKSFPQLLREVYAAYPKFATKSQFAG